MGTRCMAWCAVVCLAAVMAAWAVPVYANSCQALLEPVGQSGTINWSAAHIEATGVGVHPDKYYGKPRAQQLAEAAAREDAVTRMLDVVAQVRVTSSSLAGDAVMGRDEMVTLIKGVHEDAEMVRREYQSDGTVNLTYRMPLQGGFNQLLLPPEIVTVQEVKPMDSATSAVQGFLFSSGDKAKGKVFTGLIVDARSISAFPALAPKILDEDGKEVYGAAFVSREFAVDKGMCGYSANMDTAEQDSRVAGNPLTVKGIRTAGDGQSDIVISNADADLVRSASQNLSLLKQCRVMIVLKGMPHIIGKEKP